MDLLNYLIGDHVDVCSTFGGADAIDERNLAKLPIGNRDYHLPAVGIDRIIPDFWLFFLTIGKIKAYVLYKGVRFDFRLVQKDFD